MSNLKCNVGNCMNNEHGLCVRATIKVDGDNAQKPCDTFCHSFNHRMESMQNSVMGRPEADESTDIKCSACECTYNNECRCSAEDVEVKGNGACRYGETECASFRKK